MKINIKNISLSAMAIIAFASCSDVVEPPTVERLLSARFMMCRILVMWHRSMAVCSTR